MSKALVIPADTVFGRLTVMGEAEPYISPSGVKLRRLRCICSCGQAVEVTVHDLRNGDTTSCGCRRSEVTTTMYTKHGEAKAGRATYLYITWRGVKDRCYNSACDRYSDYGGRGIQMYADWLNDYASFASYVRATLGERPNGQSLDRVDNDRGYEPGNLRWATATQQARHTRRNVVIEVLGKRATLAEWAEAAGLPYMALHKRLFERNWPVEKALTTPLHRAAE